MLDIFLKPQVLELSGVRFAALSDLFDFASWVPLLEELGAKAPPRLQKTCSAAKAIGRALRLGDGRSDVFSSSRKAADDVASWP
jgi:hypothetical protein